MLQTEEIDNLTIPQIVQDPALSRSLRDHVTRSHGLENLLFYEAVLSYQVFCRNKTEKDYQQVRDKALDIVEAFLVEDSKTALTIGGLQKELVFTTLKYREDRKSSESFYELSFTTLFDDESVDRISIKEVEPDKDFHNLVTVFDEMFREIMKQLDKIFLKSFQNLQKFDFWRSQLTLGTWSYISIISVLKLCIHMQYSFTHIDYLADYLNARKRFFEEIVPCVKKQYTFTREYLGHRVQSIEGLSLGDINRNLSGAAIRAADSRLAAKMFDLQVRLPSTGFVTLRILLFQRTIEHYIDSHLSRYQKIARDIESFKVNNLRNMRTNFQEYFLFNVYDMKIGVAGFPEKEFWDAIDYFQLVLNEEKKIQEKQDQYRFMKKNHPNIDLKQFRLKAREEINNCHVKKHHYYQKLSSIEDKYRGRLTDLFHECHGFDFGKQEAILKALQDVKYADRKLLLDMQKTLFNMYDYLNMNDAKSEAFRFSRRTRHEEDAMDQNDPAMGSLYLAKDDFQTLHEYLRIFTDVVRNYLVAIPKIMSAIMPKFKDYLKQSVSLSGQLELAEINNFWNLKLERKEDLLPQVILKKKPLDNAFERTFIKVTSEAHLLNATNERYAEIDGQRGKVATFIAELHNAADYALSHLAGHPPFEIFHSDIQAYEFLHGEYLAEAEKNSNVLTQIRQTNKRHIQIRRNMEREVNLNGPGTDMQELEDCERYLEDANARYKSMFDKRELVIKEKQKIVTKMIIHFNKTKDHAKAMFLKQIGLIESALELISSVDLTANILESTNKVGTDMISRKKGDSLGMQKTFEAFYSFNLQNVAFTEM
eukprot:snap_masked-scaffold_14-processed-gene-11.34-mRNA-1 protein AED:1.00 eAED:1.00 QI:0/0/0/0/1/1/2/0/819